MYVKLWVPFPELRRLVGWCALINSACGRQGWKDLKFKVIFALTVSSRPLGIHESPNQGRSKRLRGWREIAVWGHLLCKSEDRSLDPGS